MAGIASIRLELRADSAAALSVYRRLGFTETQLVPGYCEGHVAARRMTLRLCADASWAADRTTPSSAADRCGACRLTTLSRLSPFARAVTHANQFGDERWRPAVRAGPHLDKSCGQQVLCHRTERRLRLDQQGQLNARPFDFHHNLRVGWLEIGDPPQ